MSLNIKDPEVDRIVRELAAVTGESITVTVRRAATERLERLQGGLSADQKRADGGDAVCALPCPSGESRDSSGVAAFHL